jgi:hypothetical protein
VARRHGLTLCLFVPDVIEPSRQAISPEYRCMVVLADLGPGAALLPCCLRIRMSVHIPLIPLRSPPFRVTGPALDAT